MPHPFAQFAKGAWQDVKPYPPGRPCATTPHEVHKNRSNLLRIGRATVAHPRRRPLAANRRECGTPNFHPNGKPKNQSTSPSTAAVVSSTPVTRQEERTGTASLTAQKGAPPAAGPLPTATAYNLTFPGPNNGSVTYKFCDANVPVNIPSTETPGVDGYTSLNNTRLVTQSIVLPNGTTWIFEYNDRNPGDPSSVNFGIPTTITLPTGGTINYTYTTIKFDPSGVASWSRWVASRTVNANDGTGPHTWTYAYANVGQTAPTTTVTDPLGNNTVHTFSQVDGYRETETQIYQLIGGVQTLQKTVQTAYALLNGGSAYYPNITALPKSVTTTWPNNQVTQVQTDYDSQGSGGFWSYGNLIAKREYAYGTGAPGALLRTTTINYLALSNSNYLANNLLNLKSSVQITDGGGTQRAYTTYGYDAYSLAPSGITTQHDSNPPAGTYRGNLTSVAKWLNTTGGYLTSPTHYFDTGEIQTATDPKGNSTTYAYSSTYAGSLPTAVTNALNQTSNYGYDFNTGLLTSAEDPNGKTTSYTYDNMWRLATATYPDGGLSSITHQETTFPFTATLTKKITSSLNYATTSVFDGLGRESENQITSDPSGTDLTDTTYDALGRKATLSNPYRTSGDIVTSTEGTTSYQYDALSRPTLVTKADGSTVRTAYCGSTTLVTDESAHWRRSTTDGLGRLVEVDEPNSLTASVNADGCPSGGDPIWVTAYTYDTLDDLVSVVQGGSHNRTFVYDSLKRLTSSLNPETGTTAVTYAYDADSNVITKTDARGIIINYSPTNSPIDALNRVTSKTYSDGTPTVTYYYDGNAPTACSAGSFTYTNPIGRRTGMCDAAAAAGSEFWSYDSMGRENAEQRTTNSITKSTSYTYNLDGSPATLTYPSGTVATYTYNAAAQAINLSTLGNPNFASNGYYTPSGGLMTLTIGSNLTTIYNQRLQPCWIYQSSISTLPWSYSCTQTVPTNGNILDLKYTYNSGADNGNVIGITNNRDTTRSQSFTYDQVNRLVTAETASTYATSPAHCWGESYVYDNATSGEFGNLTNINVASTPYNGCTQESLSVAVSATNQITGFSYDPSGNTLNDTHNSYAWNAESEIKTAAGVNYTYDGDGDRIQKSSGKIYWYGAGSEILDESDSSGNITDEYVFFGGKRVAHRVVSGNTISYYTEDMLGTSRAIFNAGVLCYDADFYPFGGERAYTNTCTQNYKFEGKERDTETNNDDFGARYYSSAFGRWTSPDWSAIPAPVPYANLTNPQTLNLYAMARDNPETFADLDGHLLPSIELFAALVGDPGPNDQKQQPPPPPPAQGATQDQPAQQQNDQKPSKWPHGGGVGVGGTADAGVVVTGAAATGSIAGGVFYKPGKGLSTGATATGGAVAYAGKKDAGAPKQDRPARNLGASAGAGAFVFVTNATSANQLSGHFQTTTLNVGFGPIQATIQLSTGNGIWELSVSPPYGGASIGASVSRVTTETCSTPGGC